jgi:mannosyltransferase OCH1-like enzyme
MRTKTTTATAATTVTPAMGSFPGTGTATSTTSSPPPSVSRLLLWLLFVAVAMTMQLLWNLKLADALSKAAFLNSLVASAPSSVVAAPPSPPATPGVRGGGREEERAAAAAAAAHPNEEEAAAAASWRVGRPLSLDELTRSSYSSCPASASSTSSDPNLVYIDNLPIDEAGWNKIVATSAASPRSIPPVIHQTSKSRCVTPKFAAAVQKWKAHNESFYYYLHDDEAVTRLFQNMYGEFPLLEMVVSSCVPSGAILSDLWRYVVLWKYGGIYMDIDSIPGEDFDPSKILAPEADGVFVVEFISLLSQYFIAVSPRHPVMYYAIQHTLRNLLWAKDTGAVHAPTMTGPHALHEAYRSFRADAGARVPAFVPQSKPVKAGTFAGTYNRTVTALGTSDKSNAYVQREILSRTRKQAEYDRMSMKHFSDVQQGKTGTSCLKALLDRHWMSVPGSNSHGGAATTMAVPPPMPTEPLDASA